MNQGGTKVKPKWNQSVIKMVPKSRKVDTKIVPKWLESETKMLSNSYQCVTQNIS